MKHISGILFLALLTTAVSVQAQSNRFKKLIHPKAQLIANGNTVFQGKKAVYPDSIQQYSFDPFNQSYSSMPGYTSFPTYDANGNLTQEIRLSNNPQNSNNKSTYQYDANGELKEYIGYGWNSQTKTWENQNKMVYYKNDKGADTLSESYQYDPQLNQWELQYASGYSMTYDNADRLTVAIAKSYDAQQDEWTIEQRIRFNYQGTDAEPFEAYVDELDNLMNWQEVVYVNQMQWGLGFSGNLEDFEPTVYMVHEWDGMDWVQSEYDSSVVIQGNIVANFYSYFDDMEDKFILENTSTYQFDAQGAQIYACDITWSNGLADTSSIEIDSFTYGSNGEILEHVNSYTSFWGSRMEYKYKEIYFYGNTGLTSKSTPSLNVYPNPIASQGVLFIDAKNELKQVQLIAVDGRVVKEWKNELNSGISMEGLNSGLYFIRALDQTGMTYSGRVQVK